MKIEKIIIENYKSIKRLEIPMDNDYGENNTVFLLGLNESGKSSVLEAIRYLGMETGFAERKYSDLCYTPVQEKKEEILVIARGQLTDEEHAYCMNLVAEENPVLGDDIGKIKITSIIKYASLDSKGAHNKGIYIYLNFGKNFDFKKYTCADGVTVAFADSDEKMDAAEESESAENSSILTSDTLEIVILNNIRDALRGYFPTVKSWKPSPEHLLMDAINLSEYKDDIDKSIPLTNIFFLHGKKDSDSIKEAVEWALDSKVHKAALEEALSDVATDHVNSVWKGHPIKIKVKIDGEDISFMVVDEGAKYTFTKMGQRSDGFKQFVSLLLTLSAQYKGEMLEGNILLLDEPEAHLHPSGIRHMRDEIFKIAHSNQVFVATHSPMMVDYEMPERHWLTTKNEAMTELRFLDKESMKDEEVMRIAFGINVMKEIMPDNLLFVEGETDKKLLEFALHTQRKKQDIVITVRPAGGSKTPMFASVLDSMLDPHDINSVIFLLDADGKGKKMRKEIIENRVSFNKNNVFTLADLLDDLPKNATIEDLIPESSVAECLAANDKKWDSSANQEVCVLSRIVALNPELKNNGKEMSKIKLKMAEQAIGDYSRKNEKEYARLFELVKVLLERMRQIRSC